MCEIANVYAEKTKGIYTLAKTKNGTREADTQRLILDWLAAKGILAFRMNTGAMRGVHKGKAWFVRFGVPGMADVLAFRVSEDLCICGPCPARCLFTIAWIEVKGEKGVQSEEQKSFQQLVESHGHSYVLARSLEDVEKVLG